MAVKREILFFIEIIAVRLERGHTLKKTLEALTRFLKMADMDYKKFILYAHMLCAWKWSWPFSSKVPGRASRTLPGIGIFPAGPPTGAGLRGSRGGTPGSST